GGVPGREHDPERRPPRRLGILAVEDVDGEVREQTAVGTEHGGASGRFRPCRQGPGAEEEGAGGRSAHRPGDGLAGGVDAEGVLIVPGQAQHPPPGDVGDDDDEPVGALGRDRRSRIGQFEVAPGAHPCPSSASARKSWSVSPRYMPLWNSSPCTLPSHGVNRKTGERSSNSEKSSSSTLCASLSADSPAALSAPTIAPAEVPAMRWKS